MQVYIDIFKKVPYNAPTVQRSHYKTEWSNHIKVYIIYT